LRAFIILACLVLSAGCGDDFATAQAEDTIASYETYLAANPEGRFEMQATLRLEELVLQDARAKATLEAYDVYLERFPEGALHEKALGERETFLYDWANLQNTAPGWQKFLDEYPSAGKKRKQHARKVLKVLAYADSLDFGEVTQKQINLAEDPDGPLNGWAFQVMVTNKGDKTIEALWLTIEYLGEGGVAFDKREWPLVAAYWPTPIEEERKLPMKPGETRAWDWSTGSPGELWSKEVRVIPTRISFVGEE
jgi:hypothetical protein